MKINYGAKRVISFTHNTLAATSLDNVVQMSIVLQDRNAGPGFWCVWLWVVLIVGLTLHGSGLFWHIL